MSSQLTDQDQINLASGIAAFEAKNFAQSLALLGPVAEKGNLDAQYRLAIMYQNGLGLVRNELLAMKWMVAAANQGFALAQHGLGFMYMEGDCVAKNSEKAVIWFKKAAEQGMAGSQTTLAMMYETGNGVVQDSEEAKKWYRLAGFAEDEMNLGQQLQ
jgi:TPR repeat protein